ncbi:MAG: dihydroorotate dehydrogenase [Spirochaetia bacterium]|nr:dihydroorotate dehydrogenase [Spirochaetia bacterium]
MKKTLRETLEKNHCKKEIPLYLSTVSGVITTNKNIINFVDKKVKEIDIITTKSYQVTPNLGNREPILCETEMGNFGNSVGLRNPGLEKAIIDVKELKDNNIEAFLNVSVSANTIEDFITLCKAFNNIADSIELNFSCPHASKGFGSSIGCDINIASEYVKEIKNSISDFKSLLFIKLTPNVENIGEIAKACIANGADGIVAINTVGPIVHIDPVSKTPILQNKLGGKGGMSGNWVYQRALECVKEIRENIGDEPILLGMGGVDNGLKARAMVEVGCDAVGIGSAFARVKQPNWSNYLKAIKQEYKTNKIESNKYLIHERQMEYKDMKINSIAYHGNDTIIIELDKNLSCKAGEFAFLWLPGIGEKPFTLSNDEPVTFVIKRRGEFTKALWDLNIGDTVFVRGIYGSELENRVSENALLIAGGTGVAVLPSLCKKLKKEKTKLQILVGTSEVSNKDALLEYALAPMGDFKCVCDDGVVARVLNEIDTIDIDKDINAYLVGPEIFMANAAKKLIDRGFNKENIYLSMEKSTRCGVGMCGECVCGEVLTCQSGTFLKYEYLEEFAPEVIKR